MMLRGIVPLELVPPGDGHEVQLMVREPGIVRGLGFALKKRAVVSLTDKAEYDEVAVLFVECDPDGARRARTFALVPLKRGIEAPPGGRVEWVATSASASSGVVINVFEIIGPAAGAQIVAPDGAQA